ncbi:hypothetical protein [Sphingobium ummariense]
MTAINMMVQPKARAGFIIADTAVTDEGGQLVDSVGKVAIGTGAFPHAIGITGNVHPVTFATALGTADARNLKQLMRRLPAIIRSAIAEHERIKGTAGMILLKGVAWDFRRKGPMGFVMTSDASLLAGAEPYEFYETAWNVTLCDGAETASEMLGRPVDLCDPDSFDPEEDGRKLIMRQYLRGGTSLLPGLGEGTSYRIGGEAHLVEVRKAGVQAWTIHDFGDEIGKPIVPRSPS